MANRRCLQALSCQASSLSFKNPSLKSLTSLPPSPNFLPKLLISKFLPISANVGPNRFSWWSQAKNFSSNGKKDDIEEYEDDDDDGEGEEDEDSDDENVLASSGGKREYSLEEKEAEAAEIGYKVIGPLEKNDRVFKPYEPVFAVVQIGSHQFKVSNRDCIFTERLKFCEVNDKLVLNKVLLLGSSSQTIIGRPIVPDSAVHAVVEEHALDAKVMIFKKKRRKNYRRTKGHRQELTKLRITDIQGIDKPEKIVTGKPSEPAKSKPEKEAVLA